MAAAKLLAEAVALAQEGETVSPEAGIYCLEDTLVLPRGIAIRALQASGFQRVCVRRRSAGRAA